MVNQDDSEYLEAYGYKQQLDRKLGSFSTFAAGFSYISILTGAFQLFYVAFGFAGPAFWWTWPVVFFGQLCVGFCFAELSAHHPLAGSVYSWSKQLAGKFVSWMAGWLMFVACTVTVAGVALAMQVVLPAISPVFQIVGDGTGTYDFSANAVVLGTILIILTTFINAVGVRLISVINNIGVAVELVAAVLLIVLLAVHIKRGPQIILDTAGHVASDGGPGAIFGALLASSLLATYILWGFDTAGSVAEETIDPRRRSPRAIIQALAAAGISGALIMLFAMMAVSDINAEELSVSGLPYVITSVLGDTLGKAFLIAAAISIFVCCLTVQTGTVRVAFALARDNTMPGSKRIAKVSDKTRTPIFPTIVVGVIAVIILLVNTRQPQIFTVVTSVVVVLAYLSYLLVTVPMLVRRFRGTWPPRDQGKYFSLGRWGVPVNIIAIAMGLFAVVNMVWPRSAVYNPVAPFHWYLQWGGVIVVAVVVLAGLAWYAYHHRERSKNLMGGGPGREVLPQRVS